MHVQQYQYEDVEAAIAQARSFFDAYVVPPNASHVVVLDIDETALSNERPRIGEAWDDWSWGLRPGQQAEHLLCLRQKAENGTQLWTCDIR